MPKNLLILTSAFLLAANAFLRAAPPQTEETFSGELTRPVGYHYLLSLPKGYDSDGDKQWPLVLFLHGAGERGDDLEVVKKHGPPKLVEAGKEFPFILVSPQCPEHAWWDPEALLALIESVESTHRVDPARIYVTGLSMGGFGTWELAGRHPEKFAAAAPICGGGSWILARGLAEAQLPIWVFHGAKDNSVPLSESERMVDLLKKRGSESVKFTIYPDAAHDSWTETYDNPEFFEWLRSNSRGSLSKGC